MLVLYLLLRDENRDIDRHHNFADVHLKFKQMTALHHLNYLKVMKINYRA